MEKPQKEVLTEENIRYAIAHQQGWRRINKEIWVSPAGNAGVGEIVIPEFTNDPAPMFHLFTSVPAWRVEKVHNDLGSSYKVAVCRSLQFDGTTWGCYGEAWNHNQAFAMALAWCRAHCLDLYTTW